MNPKLPELDPKDVTKQMLLTCKVFRKRNSNVTPLKSHRAHATYRLSNKSNSPIGNYQRKQRVNAAVVVNPPKQSLDEYLDSMSMEAKARTAIASRECDVINFSQNESLKH